MLLLNLYLTRPRIFDPIVLRIIGGLVLPFAQSALEGKGEDGRHYT